MKFRYPGVNFFTKEDEKLFWGRKSDAERLFVQLSLSKTLVLHADSGVGKSSLIQAGLLPLLDKPNDQSYNEGDFTYMPIILRLDEIKKNASTSVDAGQSVIIQTIIERINNQAEWLNGVQLPYLDGVTPNNLWIIGKKLATKRIRLLIILDQFEELQTLTRKEIVDFKQQLSQALSSTIPQQIYAIIKANTAQLLTSENITEAEKEQFNINNKLLENPVDTKVLFVVREDKLGTMSLLADCFPDILKNDFILAPLKEDDAYKAVVIPAEAEGEFFSQKFTFANEALVRKMLREIADNDTKLIDPLQIQIVCSTIEKNVVIKLKKTKIQEDDIPPIKDIISDFYSSCWRDIKETFKLDEDAFEKVKVNIIEELIVGESRNLFQIGAIATKDKKNNYADIVERLTKTTGLLKSLPTGKDTFYQLCHDRFILPVQEDRKHFELLADKEKAKILLLEKEKEREREILSQQIKYKAEQEKREADLKNNRKILLMAALVVLVILAGIMYNANRAKKDLEKEKLSKEELESIYNELKFTKDSLQIIAGAMYNTNKKLRVTDSSNTSNLEILRNTVKKLELEKAKSKTYADNLQLAINSKDTVNKNLVAAKERINRLVEALLRDSTFISDYRIELKGRKVAPDNFIPFFKEGGDALLIFGEFGKARSAFNIAGQLGDSLSQGRLAEVEKAEGFYLSVNAGYERGDFRAAQSSAKKLIEISPSFEKVLILQEQMSVIDTCIINTIQSAKSAFDYQEAGVDAPENAKGNTVIDFEDCEMSYFPNGYADSLKEFKTIILNNLGIIRLPIDFEKLDNLNQLYSNGNKFTTLPECFGKMKSLVYLDINDCYNLTEIKGGIENSKSLRGVSLAGCDSAFVGEFFKHYTNLKTVEISANNNLPITYADLNGLKYLLLRTSANELPYNLGINNKVEVLRIFKSKAGLYRSMYYGYTMGLEKYLQQMPSDFAKWSNLKYLVLEGFRYEQLSIQKISNIKKLIPPGCRIFTCSTTSKSSLLMKKTFYELLSTSKDRKPVSQSDNNYINSLIP